MSAPWEDQVNEVGLGCSGPRSPLTLAKPRSPDPPRGQASINRASLTPFVGYGYVVSLSGSGSGSMLGWRRVFLRAPLEGVLGPRKAGGMGGGSTTEPKIYGGHAVWLATVASSYRTLTGC